MEFLRKNAIRFLEKAEESLDKEELAYVASRYFDVEYSRKVAENSLRLAKMFAEVAGIV